MIRIQTLQATDGHAAAFQALALALDARPRRGSITTALAACAGRPEALAGWWWLLPPRQ